MGNKDKTRNGDATTFTEPTETRAETGKQLEMPC